MTDAPFAHLAARTSYSLRDGVLRPRDLARAVAERGMDRVGIADRGGLYGAVRVAQACAEQGVTPVFGTDLALRPDPTRPGWETRRGGRVRRSGEVPAAARGTSVHPSRKLAEREGAHRRWTDGRSMRPATGPAWLEDDAARVNLVARDGTGYARMVRTVSDHHLESVRGDPHLSWEQATRRLGAGGVAVLLGDDSPVARLLDAGRHDAAADEARRWMDLVGPDDLLVGVTHHLAPGDDERARARFALADRLGLCAVAHQAPRYLDPGDARIADVMDAVRRQVPLSPRHSTRRNAEGYLKTPAQMARVFAERPDAITNAAAFAASCDVDLRLGQLRVPDFVDLGGAGDPLAAADAELRARCEAGVNDRYAAPGRVHRELLDAELAMISRLCLAPYFLTVAEIMERIREKGIMAACRGSAAGSLVIYALRISDVDPVAHDLVYERFMNPYRDELPDIDIDVESARREDIYRDLLDRYGNDRVACVCMVDTFKARMAIREVGKAMGLPAGEVDYVAKSFPHVRAGDVRPALAHLPELEGLNLDAGQLGLLFDVVERLDGLPRHLALHPSGVVLADVTLRDDVPLESSAAGFAMAQYDKDDVEALGLCKLDVLSVRMLSSMAHCREEVARVRGVELDFDRVPWNDEPTFELIRSTRTLGMFQIESPGQRELVGKFQPEHLDDLVVDISLFRPGPVKGDMVGPFLQRRLGQSKRVRGVAKRQPGGGDPDWYPHPLLERALGETFGVIVYHEQVMRCVQAVTGCDLAVADLVRRRLGDPTELEGLHTWITDGARERGVPEDVAESLWVALAQFASFGFCKAHAAAFSVPTYRSAWLKAHYCPEFVAGLLTHDPGMYPRRLLLDDARQFGIAVLPIDVNRSARDYRVERLRADDAYRALGVGAGPGGGVGAGPGGGVGAGPDGGWRLPRGWRIVDDRPVPPAGFDFGAELAPPELRDGPTDPGLRPGVAGGGRSDAPLFAARDADVAPTGAGAADGASVHPPTHPRTDRWRYGIRLALQDVAGIDDRMIDSILTGRPFTGLEDLRRRAVLSAPVAESLAHAGALDGIAGVGCLLPGGRVRNRRDVLLEVTERWSGLSRHRPSDPSRPEQLGLLPADDTDPGLTDYRASERVRAELEVLGLDASSHVIRFYDGLLDVLRVRRVVDLADTRNGQRIRVAGVKVATQTPPVKSGQRIIFLSMDDGTGVSDATFFESVHDRCAWTVFHTWLLVVEGTVHRTGKRGISVNAEQVWDLRRLMHAWRDGWLTEALAEQGRPAEQAHRDFADQAPSGTHGAAGRSGLRVAAAAGGGRSDGNDADRERRADGGPRKAVAEGWHDSRRAAETIRTGEGRGNPGQVNGRPLDPAAVQTPAARIRVPRNAPHGSGQPTRRSGSDPGAPGRRPLPSPEPGGPSRIGPNGATWADPAGRHPGVDLQDVHRLSRNDPRHPDHEPERGTPRAPGPRDPDARDPEPPDPESEDSAGPTDPDPDPAGRRRRPTPADREPPRKLWHASPGSSGH